MSENKQFPSHWMIASDYDPNQHLMNLRGNEYMNVQQRLLWFIRDQRILIAAGPATTSYVIRTELVEQDREKGFAQFKTYLRDVLGNEATMYGSETAKDFPDYAEKASTKSLGRALLMLGYGTAFASEMDEGERVVDSPVAPRQQPAFVAKPPALKPAAAPQQPTQQYNDEPATAEQQERMARYREELGIIDKSIATADNHLRYDAAEARIANYIAQWKQRKQLNGKAQQAEAPR